MARLNTLAVMSPKKASRRAAMNPATVLATGTRNVVKLSLGISSSPMPTAMSPAINPLLRLPVDANYATY